MESGPDIIPTPTPRPAPGILRTLGVGHLPNGKTFVGKVKRSRS